MLFTLEIYKADRRKKSGESLVGKYDYNSKDRATLERDVHELWPLYSGSKGYRFAIHETMVTRTNHMTGREFEERYDRPYHCSPSSETYWSS